MVRGKEDLLEGQIDNYLCGYWIARLQGQAAKCQCEAESSNLWLKRFGRGSRGQNLTNSDVKLIWRQAKNLSLAPISLLPLADFTMLA